jgi:putative membrane protein
VRGAFGGVLMGLANLVPGISGGTMLLAAGIYPQFIGGVAEITTLRFRWRTIALLGVVVVAAIAAIILGAGPIKQLVVERRWIMYALFIGLTLGGVPLLWRMLKPIRPAAIVGAIVGLAAMTLLAIAQMRGAGTVGDGAEVNYALLVVAGLAGGAAMILPGVSGGYLLLVLGQYIVILGAIDDAKTAAGDRDWAALGEALKVFIPVGIGVVVGVVGLSNLLKWLLDRFEQATLGVLMGLLLGAVLGLWPFQRPIDELPLGSTVKGQIVTVENRGAFELEDYPTAFFTPGIGQALGAAGLVLVGFGTSVGIARLGRNDRATTASPH